MNGVFLAYSCRQYGNGCIIYWLLLSITQRFTTDVLGHFNRILRIHKTKIIPLIYRAIMRGVISVSKYTLIATNVHSFHIDRLAIKIVDWFRIQYREGIATPCEPNQVQQYLYLLKEKKKIEYYTLLISNSIVSHFAVCFSSCSIHRTFYRERGKFSYMMCSCMIRLVVRSPINYGKH